MKLDLGETEDAEGYSYRRVGSVRYCFAKTEIVPGWTTTEVWKHMDDCEVELEETELLLIWHTWQYRPELLGYFRVFP